MPLIGLWKTRVMLMGRRKKGDPINGWLILDKPLEMSSTQALAKARYILNARKAGHAGTLDPMATGVLPLAFGEATKTVAFMQDASKTYRFTVTWGVQTNTDDTEGEAIETSDLRPSEDDIIDLLQNYQGVISQTPPQFSAIKIDGQRAYAMARKGEDVKIASREVTIYDLELTEYSDDYAIFECECSKGTYVRSLARDMGRDLGCFGHISELRRIAVGVFDENDAISLDELSEMMHSAPEHEVLLPVEAPLDDIPALFMTDDEALRLRSGQSVVLFSKDGQNRMNAAGLDATKEKETIVLTLSDHKPICLAEVTGAEIKPKRVLNI